MLTRNLPVPQYSLFSFVHVAASLAAVLSLASCETTTREETSVSMPTKEMSSSILDSRLSTLQKEAEEYPKRHVLHYQIAEVLYQKNELKQCAKALHKAIELSPRVAKYHYHLGRVYLHMSELEKAEEQFRAACESMARGRYTGPHAALGYTLARQNRLEEAIAQFEICLTIEPENPSFYYFLGSLYDIQGDEEGVIRYYREYLARGGRKHRKNAVFILKKLGVEVDTREDTLSDVDESLFESELPAEGFGSGTDD